MRRVQYPNILKVATTKTNAPGVWMVFVTCGVRLVQLSQQSLEKAHENERQAMERYNEGEISIVEVIEAQTYRQNAEINHVQAKASAQGQYSALIKALNQYK